MSDLNYSHVNQVWERTVLALRNPTPGIPLPWWPRVTDLMGGLRSNELTLLCAPTGAGKTQLLANLSAQLVMQNVPLFVAPVETGDSDFLARTMSSVHKIDLNSGEKLSDQLLISVTGRASETILNRKFYLASYDNRVEIEDMINLLIYMHETHGIRVALLDNLNFFLKVVSAQNERLEMDNSVHELVMLVKKLPIHIILVVHPKKTDGGRVVSEFDIKGSSTAVQECANVLLFNRPSEEQLSKGRRTTDRELVFRKLRKRGQSVGIPIWFGYEDGLLVEAKR